MSSLKVFNTMTGKKEPFRPITSGRVSMFVCGPTVQGFVHLGHARTYIFYDVVARYLAHLGLSVDFLMNITDVDERISTEAKKAREDPEKFAERYSKAFLEDLSALGVSSVTRFEPVSRHVDEIVRLVSLLLKEGRAYFAGGWVFFDTSTFRRYGRLSHQSKADLSLRPLELTPDKKNLADFSVWRPEILVEGKWDSPWGRGSPGWHIQDTAITLGVFGPQYDIHGGAYELIYPHHEAEIAQGESITGVSPMVRYWVHTHLVTMAGEKMSKSVGNVVTVRDALKRFSSDELRFYFLSTRYREDMDLSGLKKSVARLGRLRKAVGSLSRGRTPRAKGRPDSGLLQGFTRAMNDDFDTPSAIRALEKLAAAGARESDLTRRRALLASLQSAFDILGIGVVGSE
jgi:cysteinyl-tRNA synthetase